MKSMLEINRLMLPIHIGTTEQERMISQDIEFNITIIFLSLPKACESLNVDDTVCYGILTQNIIDFCKDKHFFLIEQLCYELYKYLQQIIKIDSQIKLKICKRPPIEQIIGNSCFTIEN